MTPTRLRYLMGPVAALLAAASLLTAVPALAAAPARSAVAWQSVASDAEVDRAFALARMSANTSRFKASTSATGVAAVFTKGSPSSRSSVCQKYPPGQRFTMATHDPSGAIRCCASLGRPRELLGPFLHRNLLTSASFRCANPPRLLWQAGDR